MTAPLLLMIMSTNSAYLGATNNAYAQQRQEARPIYFININPEVSFEGSQHYSIGNAAVPAGTTVVWINNDQGQRHSDERHAWQQHGLI